MTVITFRINTTLLFNSTEDALEEFSEQVLRTDAMCIGATGFKVTVHGNHEPIYYTISPDFDAVSVC
jgi:hypothetical protein